MTLSSILGDALSAGVIVTDTGNGITSTTTANNGNNNKSSSNVISTNADATRTTNVIPSHDDVSNNINNNITATGITDGSDDATTNTSISPSYDAINNNTNSSSTTVSPMVVITLQGLLASPLQTVTPAKHPSNMLASFLLPMMY